MPPPKPDGRTVTDEPAARRTGADEGKAMAQVARLAGVSHQTVSRVLNDSPHVRDEPKERALGAIRGLD